MKARGSLYKGIRSSHQPYGIIIQPFYKYRQAFACRNIQESNGIPHLIQRFLDIPMLESIKTKENHSTTPNRMVRETTKLLCTSIISQSFLSVNKEECGNERCFRQTKRTCNRNFKTNV